MNSPSLRRLILLAVAAGLLAASGAALLIKRPDAPKPGLHALTPGVLISSQLQSSDVADLKLKGVQAVIDMRPDGEDADEPASRDMATRVTKRGLSFDYVPVPHGDIPDSAVTALATALASAKQPVVLYCRSGRRAARTWSLYEASRAGGMTGEEILAAVKSTGQTADDLAPAIAQRILARGTSAGATAAPGQTPSAPTPAAKVAVSGVAP